MRVRQTSHRGIFLLSVALFCHIGIAEETKEKDVKGISAQSLLKLRDLLLALENNLEEEENNKLKANVSKTIDVRNNVEPELLNVIVCESKSHDLVCPSGNVLRIAHAHYGRTVSSSEVCPYSGNHKDATDCGAAGVLVAIQNRCNDLNSCRLTSSNGVFGDPCGGTYKYLNVTYSCADYRTCVASGDPHYRTFDGSMIHFQGTCKYLLAGTCPQSSQPHFRVLAKNENRYGNTRVAYVNYVDVEFEDIVVRLLKGRQVMINAELVAVPVSFSNVSVSIVVNRYVIVRLPTGISVRFDGNHIVQVSVPGAYRSTMCGICGNMNDDASDDFTTSDGLDVTHSYSDRYSQIGNSWQVHDSEDVERCSIPSVDIPVHDPPQAIDDVTYCGALTSGSHVFSTCFANLDTPFLLHVPSIREEYHENCVYDVVAALDGGSEEDAREAACAILETVAKECQLTSGSWREAVNCPMECPQGMLYTPSMSPCVATCADPRMKRCEGGQTEEGCACPSGMLVSGSRCVLPTECGCTLPDGTYIQPGDEHLSANCDTLYQCQPGSEASGSQLISSEYTCLDDEVCRVAEGRRGCFEPPVVTTPPPVVAEGNHICQASGDPHYRTYDGQMIHFQGTCKYLLSGTCLESTRSAFKVHVENEFRGRNTRVSYTRTVEVLIHNTTVVFNKGGVVTINGLRQHLPVQTIPGVYIYYSRGIAMALTSDIGVTVTFDGRHKATVSVPHTYSDQICGICGDLNGVKDDFVTRKGIDVRHLGREKYAMIGNSWVVSESELCYVPEEDEETDPINLVDGVEECNILSLNLDQAVQPLHECISEFPELSQDYYVSCAYDVVESDSSERHDAVCKIVEAFITECETLLGKSLNDWRNHVNCPLICPIGLTYSQSANECPRTCSSPVPVMQVCESIVEGCVCPQGQVLIGNTCSQEEVCSCVDNYGNLHKLGESWKNLHCDREYTCELVNGAPSITTVTIACSAYEECGIKDGKIDCVPNCGCENGGVCDVNSGTCGCQEGFTGNKCQNKLRCCQAWGDPHYITYDGARIDFQGTCSYLLSGVCDITGSPLPEELQVIVRNEKRRDTASVSFTKSVSVFHQGYNVTLASGSNVFVNNVLHTSPIQSLGGLSVSITPRAVILDSESGIRVQFDGRARATVCMPEIYHEQTCGLCGNFNDVKIDDYMTASGENVISLPRAQRNLAIGNSFHVSFPHDSCDATSEPVSDPIIDESWHERIDENEWCGMLRHTMGTFRECRLKLGNELVDEYYESCRYDTLELADNLEEAKEAACGVLEAWVHSCELVGVRPMWREAANCHVRCPETMQYYSEIEPCMNTCQDPTASVTCGLPTVDGCACPPGLLLSRSICVSPQDCGCTDDQREYHQACSSWLSEDCSHRYYCQPPTRSSAQVIQVSPGCTEAELCLVQDGELTCTHAPIDGSWGIWTEWSDCISLPCAESSGSRSRELTARAKSKDTSKSSESSTENLSVSQESSEQEASSENKSGSKSTSKESGSRSGSTSNDNFQSTENKNGSNASNYVSSESSQNSASRNSGSSSQISAEASNIFDNLTDGSSVRIRTRRCNAPAPQFNGEECVGLSVEFIPCA